MPKSNSANTPRTECGIIEHLENAEMEARGYVVTKADFTGWTFETDAVSFRAERTDEFNPAYNDSLLLTYHGRPFVHVFYNPRNSSANPASCQYKVANAALYSSMWPNLLRSCLKATRAKFVRINRVDICADFEYFANGRLPLKFCQDYLSKPTAARPTFVRKSSNKLRCAVTKKGDKLLWETLSWGNRDSAVQVNLYNKTLELETKHDKIYIREKWREYGLPYEQTQGEKKRFVWRVEFSINPAQKFVQVIKNKKGETIKGPLSDYVTELREILLSDFESQSACNRLFESLVPQFFQFYYLHRDDVRAGRRVKDLLPVVLFNSADNKTNCAADPALFKFRSYSNSRQLGRTEKILASRIDKMLDSEQLTIDEKVALSGVRALLDRARLRKAYKSNNEITADEWLQSVFGQQIETPDDVDVAHSKARKERELLRYVRMLDHAHSPILTELKEHLAGLSRIVGGEKLPLVAKLLSKVDEYLCAAEFSVQDAAMGLPEWFFDAPDEVRSYTPTEDDWESLYKSMPKS